MTGPPHMCLGVTLVDWSIFHGTSTHYTLLDIQQPLYSGSRLLTACSTTLLEQLTSLRVIGSFPSSFTMKEEALATRVATRNKAANTKLVHKLGEVGLTSRPRE